MRKVLLLCMATVILSACGGSSSKKFMGLNGHIESVKDFQYEAIEKFGEVEPGDLDEVIVYTFTPSGHLEKYGIYNDDGDCIVRTENTYNGEECTRTTFYNSYNDETSIQNLIETKGNTQIWEIRQGDEIMQSECVKSDNYSCTTKKDGTIIERQEHWFNDNGDVIEVKITKDTEIVYWSKSKFQNGNEVQTEYLTGDSGGITTYSYGDYDATGNWTKKIIYRNGEAEYIIKREIKYTK